LKFKGYMSLFTTISYILRKWGVVGKRIYWME
jgi:hypothetical protein